MIDRIQMILQTKDLTPGKLADEIGVQRSSVSHILSARNGPSLDFIQKILKRYPDIGASWLVAGIGQMYPGDAEAQAMGSKAGKSAIPDLFSSALDAKPEPNIPDSKPAAKQTIEIPAQIDTAVETKPLPLPKADLSTGGEKAETAVPEVQAATKDDEMLKVLILYGDSSFAIYNKR